MDTLLNKINLAEAEKAKWCDAELYKLLKIFLIADNESYILFDETHISRCRQEVLNRFDTL